MGRKKHRTASDKASHRPAPNTGKRAGARWIAICALVAAAAWAYSTSFAGVFLYDDGSSIADNPNIRTLWPLTRSMAAPPEVTVSGRPIASLSLALNYALAPEDAREVMAPIGPAATPRDAELFYRNIWGYHFVNLAIHVAAGLTLFGIISHTLRTPKLRDRFEAAATPLAFVVALIWIVHPLHTESVTYIVQRVESLMGLFYLLTLYCAIRATDDGTRRIWWNAGAVAACAMGMGTKEVMVSAPLVVWIWDHLFGVDRRARRPLYAGLAATWIVLGFIIAFERRPQSVGFRAGWTAWEYLRTQAAVVVHYLRLSFVPSPLVFDYGWPKAQSLAEVAPQGLLLLLLLMVTAAGLVRKHPAAFSGAWFFLILAPTSSVLPIFTEVATEHRMYLPLAAVIAVAALGTYAFGVRLLQGTPSRRRTAALAGLLIVGAVAIPFAEMTRARNRDYWNEQGLWLDTLRKRPANARARVGYAITLMTAQRFSDAEEQLRVAVQLDPTDALAHMNLGSALCAQGKLDEGIPHLERALALDPKRAEVHGLLGEAYLHQGQSAAALRSFTRALDEMGDTRASRFLVRRVAWVLATSPDASVRDGARAVEYAQRAVRLSGGRDVVALDTLAAAYAEQDRFDDAAGTIREALRLAEIQGEGMFVPELQQRLTAYAARQKVREPVR